MMKRLFPRLAALGLLCAVVLGCGGNDPVRTAPGTDTRSAQEKETDALLQKSQQDYNKRFR
jgi:hypothetical protein